MFTLDENRAGRPSLVQTTSNLTRADRWDHWLARWGVDRGGHRVAPGLYALGSPTPDSPVFVTANYTLSFDALRSALAGLNGFILVLNTEGINVWCAAGKGTFGTDELVQRIELTDLCKYVGHRELILPQLGAPGVCAHEVKQRSGFRAEYGPVRAPDLPAYLATRQATPEMRQVRFTLRDRIVLIPVELVNALLPTVIAAAVLLLLSGPLAALAALAAVLAGVVLFPVLLPWLPTHDFSTKGLFLGGLVALPFAAAVFGADPGPPLWMRAVMALAYLVAMSPVTAFLGLNFTGSTTFTSRSGVEREIYVYAPVMAGMFSVGVVLVIVLTLVQVFGGSQWATPI
jgi:hypothetical protein